ncbi:TIGR00645 family protein [uncultured Rhodospira sp.]|uniref:TIGR00645 family protein n=1 Tax=uncultured Rhodospira sp. TaxID=1936189 RepID=UPI002603CDD2|nr:TIGR00645 family protein [uncultured Rhodospira sp.]
MERKLEKVLYHSRWLLVPMYIGLALLLLILTITFLVELTRLVPLALELSEKDVILATLSLIDLTLVGSLVVMVIISGYENFVSRIEIAEKDDNLAWVGKLDAGTLKLKVASSIVAISSVHLLKAFMNVEEIDNDKLLWLVIIHMTFVLSALFMAVIERFMMAETAPASKGNHESTSG